MHCPITAPVATSRAANSEVVPPAFAGAGYSAYNHGSWCRRPFFIGSPGWVRSSAWTWLFSSTHHRLVRRAQVEADDILDFLDKSLVIRQLETAHKMRLEPVCVPNPPHTRLAETDGLGHRPQVVGKADLRRKGPGAKFTAAAAMMSKNSRGR